MDHLKKRATDLLRRSERFTKTDMVYLVGTGFWSNAGTLTSILGSFLLYVIFSHFVPKEAYGTYQYLLSLAAIAGAFTLTGMNAAITRAVARGHEGALADAVNAQLRWGIFPLIIAWCIGIYHFLAGDLLVAAGMGVVGLLVPLNATLSMYGAFLSGKKDFRRGFLYSLWWNVPYYAAVGSISYLVPDLLYVSVLLLCANLGAQSIGLFIAFRQTIATYRPGPARDPGTMSYGKHLSVMGLYGSMVAQADSILAFHLLGASGLAVYSFATAIPDRMTGLFKFIPVSILPKLSGKDPAYIRTALGGRFWAATAGMGVVALATMFLIGFVFDLFFPAYREAVPYAQLYSLVIVTSLSTMLTTALTAARATRSLYAYSIVSPTAQLILQAAGALLYGLWGLVAARVIMGVLNLSLAYFLYRRLA